MYNIKDKLYISSFSENYIREIKHHALGIELGHACISHCLDATPAVREKLIRDIKNDLALTNASKIILHGPFTEICPYAVDYRFRELSLERLNAAYEVSRLVGCHHMVVHSGWIPKLYIHSYQLEQIPLFWQKFMKDKPSDFHLYIENVLEDTPEIIAEIMGRISDSRIMHCLDIGHAFCYSEKKNYIERWLRSLSTKIGHIHLHNNHKNYDSHGGFEDGDIDFSTTLPMIGELCPNLRSLTIESLNCSPCMHWLMDHHYL